MHPIIIDEHTGKRLFNSAECAEYIGVSPRTWSNYYANHRTPEPVATWGKSAPLWDAEEVKTWHAARPGSPIPSSVFFVHDKARSYCSEVRSASRWCAIPPMVGA